MAVLGGDAVRSRSRPVGRREVATCALWALLFGAAPTVGDVGSCGDTATLLALQTFQAERKAVDCQRCQQCGLTTTTCTDACNPRVPSDVAWPPSCRPLAEDGVVCIDALQAASCGAYASYVSDSAPTVPTECDFCHDIPDGGVHTGDL
jgi:hypothetical protein